MRVRLSRISIVVILAAVSAASMCGAAFLPSYGTPSKTLHHRMPRQSRSTIRSMAQSSLPRSLRPLSSGTNLTFVLESRGDFASAISTLENAVALSRSKDWRCLAELAEVAEVYEKTGRTADAIPADRQALDLAVKQNISRLQELSRTFSTTTSTTAPVHDQIGLRLAENHLSLCGIVSSPAPVSFWKLS